MKIDVADFDLYPIPASIDPDGGYAGRLGGRPTIQFDGVLDEVHRRHGTDKKQLKTDFEHVFDIAAEIASDRLANIQLGQYMLLRPFLGGKFPDRRAKFNPKVNKVYLRAICKKELKIDYSKWSFHNSTDGRTLKIISCNSAGADVDSMFYLYRDIEFNGDWMQLLLDREDLEPRDRVEYSCEKPDGTTLSGELEVTDTSLHRITCKWPAALDASTVGGTVTFTVYGRCGEDDAVQQQASTKAVAIVEGDEPGPTPVEPPLIESVESQNEPEDTVNLGGAYLFVYGDNLDTATEVKVYNSHDEVVATVPVTFVPAGEMTPARLESTSQVAVEYTPEGGSENGKVEVTTAGGTNAKTVTLVSH